MNNNPLAIELLEVLSFHFPSAKQYSINEFLNSRKERKDEIVSIIKGLIENSFIHSIDYLEESIQNIESVDIKTNITKLGEDYINSFFERKSHKKNIKFDKVSDIIAKVLAVLSIGFAVYSWSVKEGKDTQIQILNDTINTQKERINSEKNAIDSLRELLFLDTIK